LERYCKGIGQDEQDEQDEQLASTELRPAELFILSIL